ncbi:hypothetical protein [Entomobacter blattae]|uniref:Uncharacterized protein n=1 Tax=Entomobacter blattae TaxID=2762277 RepID=A0A7H1NQF2_9PROT|nr:hypothetical protein [Entomobacter blattae]QNT78012.1 hypothetical protein JGUZn3_07790 [Entomobacter blattae]
MVDMLHSRHAARALGYALVGVLSGATIRLTARAMKLGMFKTFCSNKLPTTFLSKKSEKTKLAALSSQSFW